MKKSKVKLPTPTVDEVAQGNADFIEGLLRIDDTGDGLVSIEAACYLFRRGIIHGYRMRVAEEELKHA